MQFYCRVDESRYIITGHPAYTSQPEGEAAAESWPELGTVHDKILTVTARSSGARDEKDDERDS